MECEQAQPLMAAHLARQDTPEEWEALGHHLRSCQACGEEAEGLSQTWQALGDLPDADPPAAAWDQIQAGLPAPQPVRQARWAASVGTAALGLLASIAASWLLPYERAASLCGEALRRIPLLTALPDPAVFFAVGLLYGLLPLGLAALAAARRLSHTGRHSGLLAGLVFGVLGLPYVVIACSGLPAAFTAALGAGILAGALAGGPAGIWAGGRLLLPARA